MTQAINEISILGFNFPKNFVEDNKIKIFAAVFFTLATCQIIAIAESKGNKAKRQNIRPILLFQSTILGLMLYHILKK